MGTFGSLSHTAQATLAVIQPITSNTPPFRMRYVRTDAAAQDAGFVNLQRIIYNPPTSRFFVTDPETSRVSVIDAATETVVGSIPVPGAFGIDDMPDHSLLYVGTMVGDVYAIDPASMTVTHRFPAAQIGPNGFEANLVQVMADGRLALLGGRGGVPDNINGYAGIALWNPTSNSISIYSPRYCGGTGFNPCTTICGTYMGNIGAFSRTPDRTKVIIASIDSDGTVCELDEGTGANIFSGNHGYIDDFAITPDSKLIAIPQFGQAVILDAGTLSQLRQFAVNGDTGTAANFFVSPDSSTLDTTSEYATSDTEGIVYAYDLATGHQIGWLPDIFALSGYSGLLTGPSDGPDFQATDGSDLIAGPMSEGVGFLDTTALRTGPVDNQGVTSLTPNTGDVSGGTQVSWFLTGGTLSNVYFGSRQAESASTSLTSNTALTPPGAPGPADFYALMSDGGVNYLPEGFSYGPTIMQVTPNASIADGGGTGIVYGYGFADSSSSAIPSGLQVTVGGQPAKITAFTSSASLSPTFPLQAFTYTIPAGQAGTSVDVSVNTSSGTATLRNGMEYLPSIQKYALAGSAMAEGIYDPYNDLYYFTDATEIRVFSKTNGQWLPPITIPPTDNPQRLWGIAISPDGSKIAVTDTLGLAIYVLDPANPSIVQKFPMPPAGTNYIGNPAGVCISDAGIVYFTGSGYFKLDTSTGQFIDYHLGTGNNYQYLRTVISKDNSRVYFNNVGQVFSVDTATDNKVFAREPGCCNDELALSADGTRFAATDFFYDPLLNPDAHFALNDREAADIYISYIYGQKLNPDGRLLFQPTTLGIDVMDGHLGTLLDRIALPVPLSPNYDALVSDGKDNVLVAITGSNGDGIAVIDLTSIPEPAPLLYSAGITSNTRFAASLTFSTMQSTSPPKQKNAEAQKRPGLRGIRHVTVRNLLRRFRQQSPAAP